MKDASYSRTSHQIMVCSDNAVIIYIKFLMTRRAFNLISIAFKIIQKNCRPSQHPHNHNHKWNEKFISDGVRHCDTSETSDIRQETYNASRIATYIKYTISDESVNQNVAINCRSIDGTFVSLTCIVMEFLNLFAALIKEIGFKAPLIEFMFNSMWKKRREIFRS